jgi:hypothetical protein
VRQVKPFWLFVLGWLLLGSAFSQSARVLAVAIDYQPNAFVVQLSQLKSLGVGQVVVRLTDLPTPQQWQAMLDALDRSELEWWLSLANMPRTHGWVVLPERYRLRGTEQGVYTVEIPAADQTLLALSPYDQPMLSMLMPLTLSGGRAALALGNTATSVLLFYPRITDAIPDLWEGWDRYRDALCAMLLLRKPAGKFRGWLIESGWDAQSAAAFPDTPQFRAEWLGFLKQRYGEVTELERAWDLSASLKRYEQAASLIPLWHSERGLPVLASLEAMDALVPAEQNAPRSDKKSWEVDPRNCRFWDDYSDFLAERWRTLLKGLRQTLLHFTPDAEFQVAQPMPDSTDLPVPDPLRDPMLPFGYHLPATQRSEWRTFLILESARSPLRLVMLDWQGEPVERAGLVQELAREMGVFTIIWRVRDLNTLPQESWQWLRAADRDPSSPTFIPFPISLWGVTSVQKLPMGWWLPSESSNRLQPLFWGFEPFAFSRTIEVQQLDKEGKPTTAQTIELYLWTAGEEREVRLRRFDQAPLEAVKLNGETVPLSVRGDTVRLRVGSVPVRVRGFETLPLCESVVDEWSQRVAELLKRGTSAAQDTQVLRFVFDGALSTYRRDRVQGFPLVRNAWLDIESAFRPYRLIEAERATEQTFGTVRRDLSASGGATLWLHTPLKPIGNGYYASYALNIRTEGSYNLYLACRLPATPDQPSDTIEWQIVRGGEEASPIARGVAPLDAERAVSRYSDRFVWLPLGNATLPAGDYILQLRYVPSAERRAFYAEWDMLLVAPPGIVPRSVLPPAY